LPVTIQWTTESGTGSSAANAWISACSTTTAGYPGCPPAGPADRGVDGGCLGGRGRGTALGATAGKPGGFSARSGVPGTVEGSTAGFASAGLFVGCGGHRCWLGGRVACGGGASGGRRKARRADIGGWPGRLTSVWCSQQCWRAAYEERRAAKNGAVAVRVEAVEKPVERMVERVRIETRHVPPDPAGAAQIVLRSPRMPRGVGIVNGRSGRRTV
jgi:hypothetical protein